MAAEAIPTHLMTSRAPTDLERRQIEQLAKPCIASVVYVILFLGVVPIVGLGFVGGWLGKYIVAIDSAGGRWIGAIIGGAILVYSLISYIRFERRSRARAERDVEAQSVEELLVRNPRVFQISLINDNEPIVVFDIGESQLLFLQGQWLYDPHTYGGQKCDDEGDEFLNALPAPYSFPSTEFTITRLPNSGEVLGIEVKGTYLRPEKEVDALKTEYEFGQSEIFTGELESIAQVLSAEHARRFSS